jgi:hypothetical protein
VFYSEALLPASPVGTFRIPSDYVIAEDDRASAVWLKYSQDNITWSEVRIFALRTRHRTLDT